MNLFDVILSRAPKSPAFLLDDRQITPPMLIAAREQYSGVLFAAAEKPVALCLQSVSHLVHCIILLNGICPRIALIPREVNAEVRQLIVSNSGSQVVISDYLTQNECSVPLLPFSQSTGPLPLIKFDSEWLLPTSGTTGTPMLIPHTMASLTKTVKLDNGKGSSLCWGTLYDIRRFAGLQVFLQAVLGGSTLALRDDTDTPLPELLSWYCSVGVNALSATPTMWQKLLMTPESEGLNLKQITLGGEIVRQRILDALATRYPNARICHIYASTEFGVGFSVTDRQEGFPAIWLYGEHPIGRIEADSSELLLRKGDSWFATGDAVEVHNDRILFLGRLNGSINVGGNKVMPEEVERTLLQYPGVVLASVSAQKSSIMGNLVQAEIVAHIESSPQEFQRGLMEHCRQLLEPYKVPAFIKIVDEVSLSSSGKIVRNGGFA